MYRNQYGNQYMIFSDNSNSNCYICMESIDYYLKFECGCYNFLHTECFTDCKLKNCLICKNKLENLKMISESNNCNNLDIDINILNKILNLSLTEYVLTKIGVKNIFTYYILNLKNNVFNLSTYFLITIFSFFLIFLPIIILNVILNIFCEISNHITKKINFFVILDYLFLVCFISVPIFIIGRELNN